MYRMGGSGRSSLRMFLSDMVSVWLCVCVCVCLVWGGVSVSGDFKTYLGVSPGSYISSYCQGRTETKEGPCSNVQMTQ